MILIIFGAAYISFFLPPEPFTSDKEIIARTENLPAVKAFVTKYPYVNSSLQRGSDMLVSYWVTKSGVEGKPVNSTTYEPQLILDVWQKNDPAASRLNLFCYGGNATVDATTGAITHSRYYVIEDSHIVPFLEAGKEEDCFSTNPVSPGDWIAIPKYKALIRILEGGSIEGSKKYLDPQVATVIIGVNNTVVWMNDDTVPQTLASDNDYRDPISGLFDTRDRPAEEGGAFIMPGQTWEFTFTQPGRYNYHGEPHPWVQGTIVVLEH